MLAVALLKFSQWNAPGLTQFSRRQTQDCLMRRQICPKAISERHRSTLALRAFLIISVVFATGALTTGLSDPAFATSRRHQRYIPPPPIKLLPLSKLEPARDVPAQQWRSAYCLAWSDGCTRCERNDLQPKSQVFCAPIAADESCAPTFSICAKAEPKFFDQACHVPIKVYFQRSDFNARYETAESFLRRNDAVSRDINASRDWQFELEWRNRWSVSVTDNFWQYGGRQLMLRRNGESAFTATKHSRKETSTKQWNMQGKKSERTGMGCFGWRGNGRAVSLSG